MDKIVNLPDGYNGDKMAFYATPVEEWPDGTVKLKCAEAGKENLFRWARKSDLAKKGKVKSWQ